MPTIIKPTSVKAKTSPVETKKTVPLELPSDDSFDDDLPSPPMPSIPPPPPPSFDVDEEETSSYGIALFDFESDVAEDLNLRVSFCGFCVDLGLFKISSPRQTIKSISSNK